MENLSKKKILFAITKSNWGGAQRYVYDLATGVPRDQFETAVAVGGSGALVEKLAASGVTVLPLAGLQRDLSATADVGGFLALYRAIKKYRPDVIHLNSSKVGVLGALAARLLRVPRIVFTVHGWPFEEQRNMLWRVMAFLGSWGTALFSHSVIVISTKDLRIGRRLPFCGRKMRLIFNGIDFSMPFSSGEQIRNAFPRGVHITGTVGELTQNKNHISLIEQVKNDPRLFLAIVGEGEERARLERKIQEYDLTGRVKLFGFLPASEVMKGFDTFTLPSKKEGLPYVLLEAKAAGLPIVANRVGGVNDVVDAQDMGDFTLSQMIEKTIRLYRS